MTLASPFIVRAPVAAPPASMTTSAAHGNDYASAESSQTNLPGRPRAGVGPMDRRAHVAVAQHVAGTNDHGDTALEPGFAEAAASILQVRLDSKRKIHFLVILNSEKAL